MPGSQAGREHLYISTDIGYRYPMGNSTMAKEQELNERNKELDYIGNCLAALEELPFGQYSADGKLLRKFWMNGEEMPELPHRSATASVTYSLAAFPPARMWGAFSQNGKKPW